MGNNKGSSQREVYGRVSYISNNKELGMMGYALSPSPEHAATCSFPAVRRLGRRIAARLGPAWAT